MISVIVGIRRCLDVDGTEASGMVTINFGVVRKTGVGESN